MVEFQGQRFLLTGLKKATPHFLVDFHGGANDGIGLGVLFHTYSQTFPRR